MIGLVVSTTALSQHLPAYAGNAGLFGPIEKGIDVSHGLG